MILAVLFMILLVVLIGWPSSRLLWHRMARLPLTMGTQVARDWLRSSIGTVSRIRA